MVAEPAVPISHWTNTRANASPWIISDLLGPDLGPLQPPGRKLGTRFDDNHVLGPKARLFTLRS